MFTCQNTEGVHGQRKVWAPSSRTSMTLKQSLDCQQSHRRASRSGEGLKWNIYRFSSSGGCFGTLRSGGKVTPE